jgi:Spore Coat Protein U domain
LAYRLRIQLSFNFLSKGFIMKKIALIAALGLMGMGSAFAQATTVGSSFIVQVNLTSKCQVKTAGTALDFGNYTAFGNTHTSAPTTSIVFECTRGLAPTVAFNTDNGTSSLANTTATGEGVLAGLRYTLSVAAPSVSLGAAATAGANGVNGSNGGADERTYIVTGGMDANQAGACTSGTCTGSHQRQLIVSF